MVQTPPTITVGDRKYGHQCWPTDRPYVTATGTAPLTYEWSKDGNVISTATTSTYNIPQRSRIRQRQIHNHRPQRERAATKDIFVNVIGPGATCKWFGGSPSV